MKTLLLAAGLLLTVPVMAQITTPASRLYVGLHLSAQTGQPFNNYSNARFGPALTMGAHLTPRVAVQVSSAYNWQHGTYHASYTTNAGQVVEDYETRRHTFTVPILARVTLTKPSRRWQADALAGPTLLVYVTHQDYLQTTQGEVTRSGTDHNVETLTALTLGPSVRYTLTPKVEVAVDALANLHLSGLSYGAPLSSQLFSHLLVGLYYRFG